MRVILFGGMAAMFVASAAVAQAPSAEVKPDLGAPGYVALMSNDNEGALRQLLADRSARNDPARLINIGRAHARLGDKMNARKAFEAAAKSTEEVDLVLADGSVMSSRKAALLALKALN
jgi:hypothetical protein